MDNDTLAEWLRAESKQLDQLTHTLRPGAYRGSEAGDACRRAADRIERLSAALEQCFAAACDYSKDELSMRNEITAIVRAAQSMKEKKGG